MQKKMFFCVVKNKWTKGEFSTGKKKPSSCSVRGLSIVVCFDVFFFVSYGNQPFQNRYSCCLVEPDMDFTTSDPR